METEEIWKDIEGYEGLYQVSNLGRVRSWKKTLCKYKILKPWKNGRGYLQVYLSKNGDSEEPRVHRLVASAFIPNPNNYPEINHINENKQDNRAENIEWCSREYNCNYGTRNQRASESMKGENNPNYGKHLSEETKKKLSETNGKPVLQYSLDGTFIKEWPSTREVQRQLGFDRSHIGKVCNGKYSQSRGYIWKYKD